MLVCSRIIDIVLIFILDIRVVGNLRVWAVLNQLDEALRETFVIFDYYTNFTVFYSFK